MFVKRGCIKKKIEMKMQEGQLDFVDEDTLVVEF